MARQPTLKQLKYLSAVAEHAHFGNAARACHVSQSTLSAGIQELEDALGAALVERNNKRVILTQLGQEVVQRSRAILIDVEDLVAVCDASAEPFSGKMRLGVIPTIAPFILPGLLKKLRSKHPAFQLFIREDLSHHLVDALHRGELDVLLLALPYPADNVETLALFQDDFLLAFPSGHPLGRGPQLLTSQLKDQELLLLEDGHCLRDHALDACKLKDSDVSVPYQATSLNTIVQMVANGIGITLLPAMAMDARILIGTDVKTRAFSEAGISRTIGLMWRKKTPRRTEFQLLGDFLLDTPT
ncbi:MAG: LysR family hydrogen peroxide-inducible transcriptional activator [Halieaceae bacterium]|jgi:LysR family hydrogen peroxide-inducible transcriptional activator